MSVKERIQSALRSKEPVEALRVLVNELTREGHTRSAIADKFEDFVGKERGNKDFRESDEEDFYVLDALRGWCHPAAELPPQDLSSAKQ